MAQTARLLWSLYFVMTVVEILLLSFLTDVPFYDAICNSFSTVSTGGFSPQRGSIGSYDDPLAVGIVSFFMLISGINFVILYHQLAFFLCLSINFLKKKVLAIFIPYLIFIYHRSDLNF